MPPQLKKKIGPLPLWGWLAAVALGVAIYYMRQQQTPQGEQLDGVGGLGTTGTGAFGPIDPNTGIPYAFEAPQGSTAAATGTPALSDVLGLFQQLQDAGFAPGQKPAEVKNLSKKQRARYRAQIKKLKKQRNQASKKHHPQKKRGRGHHPATSTGGGASAGGNNHRAAPHPKKRHKAKKK